MDGGGISVDHRMPQIIDQTVIGLFWQNNFIYLTILLWCK
jgi:hypothetical protein